MRRVPLFSLVLVLLFTGAFWMRVGRKPAAPGTAILWLLGPRAEQDFVHASTTEAAWHGRLPKRSEEWEQTCKNSPSSAELSTYLAAHSDLPQGLVSFVQALAIREAERRTQTHE